MNLKDESDVQTFVEKLAKIEDRMSGINGYSKAFLIDDIVDVVESHPELLEALIK